MFNIEVTWQDFYDLISTLAVCEAFQLVVLIIFLGIYCSNLIDRRKK